MQSNQTRIVNFKVLNHAADVTEIEIYDNIGEYLDWATWSVKGVTYESFKKEFESAIEKSKTINLRINTYGGDVNAGLAIYNLIQRHADKDIHVYVDSAAYSMGLVLAQAVSKGKRHAAKNATLMLHQAISTLYGYFNATNLREEADILDKFDDVLATSISDTMGMDKEQFKNKYYDGKDHFFTATEAVEAGLIDDIYELKASSVEDENDTPAESKSNILNFLNKKFDALENKVAALKNNFSNPKKSIMNLNDVLDVLKSGEEITAERRAELAAKVESFNVAKYSNEEVEEKISEATQPLENKIEELESANAELKENLDAELLNKAGGAPVGGVDTQEIKADYVPEFKGIKF